MSNISEHTIEGLTGDKGYWRIDWIGYLKYDNGMVRFSQPVVDVFVSELTGHPSAVNLYYKSATDFLKQKKVTLPVGYLVLLAIGDIWHKDRFYQSPAYKTVYFKNVLIDKAHCFSIMAKDSIGTDLFYLPFSHHPYHQKATKTYCEVVALENSLVKLIIPHYVILRSYFGSSSTLLAYLFTYGILSHDLYDESKSKLNHADGSAFIHLKTKIPDESVTQVARIAWDKQAAKSVTMISNQLTLQNNNQEVKRLKTAFPFTGRTNLKLSGKWIKRQDSSLAFVVFKIISCSAAFPFNALAFYRDNPGDKNPVSDNEVAQSNDNGHRARPINQPKSGDDLKLTPKDLPDNDSINLHLKMSDSTFFTDLSAKPVEKIRQEAHKTPANIKSIPVPVDIECGNVGEGGHDKSVAPTLFTQDGQSSSLSDNHLDGETKAFKFREKVCRLTLFFDVLRCLLRLPNCPLIRCWTLNQDNEHNATNCSYFPKTYTSTGRYSKWQFIDYQRGSDSVEHKQRSVIVAEVTINTEVFYLFEIERRILFENGYWRERDSYTILLAQHKLAKKLNHSDIQSILHYAAENKGCWPKATEKPNLMLTTIKHPQNEILNNNKQDYIDTVGRYLKDGMNLL